MLESNAPTPTVFLSTLSLRRATAPVHEIGQEFEISIHALLAESDFAKNHCKFVGINISIHALLAESDYHYGWSWYDDFTISIHALLAESDGAS